MKRSAYILFALFFCSCEVVIPFDEDLGDQEFIVLNSVIQSDKSITCNISHSVSVIANESPNYISAVVSVYENGEYIGEATTLGVGDHELEYTVVPGRNYRFEVDHPDYPSVLGEARTPLPTDFTITEYSTGVNPPSGSDNLSQYSARIKFQFQDDPERENYYALYVLDDNAFTDQTKSFISQETFMNPQDEDRLFYENCLFSDASFNGESVEITLFTTEDFDIVNDKIVLRTTDESFFLYSLAALADPGLEGFSEPIQLYNNVENGLGVCAAITDVTKNVE